MPLYCLPLKASDYPLGIFKLVRISIRRGVLDTTMCDKVCQWLVAGRWFLQVLLLLKVALNTINPKLSITAISWDGVYLEDKSKHITHITNSNYQNLYTTECQWEDIEMVHYCPSFSTLHFVSSAHTWSHVFGQFVICVSMVPSIRKFKVCMVYDHLYIYRTILFSVFWSRVVLFAKFADIFSEIRGVAAYTLSGYKKKEIKLKKNVLLLLAV